ncbi:hypothetical protein [Burkholderia catarinensis]|uniref:hypothetical protein n=1 Tax=Burkholderia catarinensis TaxID=1108140 RepID=UPI0009226097
MSELQLDHPERVLDFGPDASLDVFEPLNERIFCSVTVKLATQARAQGHSQHALIFCVSSRFSTP